MKRSNPVTLANEKVSIVTVCRLVGVELFDDVLGHRRKVRCPFGEIYHSDGGLAPAMRIYPETNSAYCFSCCAYYTPVSLAARAADIDRRTAALQLLDHVGYRPLGLAEQWQQLVQHEMKPDKMLLADALKTYCRRIDPEWMSRQFEPEVAGRLTRCLSLLDLVNTGDDVTMWLKSCKQAMQQALTERVLLPRTTQLCLGDADRNDEGEHT
jgi:hypothetical protein